MQDAKPLTAVNSERKPQRLHTIVADPHPIYLFGVAQELRQSARISLAGQAKSFVELVQLLKSKECGVLVIDFDISGYTNDTATFDYLRHRHPGVLLVVLTMHRNPETLRYLRDSGVKGIVHKEDRAIHILEAVLQVARGASYFGPTISAIFDEFDRQAA